MKNDDDQFGFQSSLDGNKEDWVTGRKRKLDYGGEWLDLYQGKNYKRKKILWLNGKCLKRSVKLLQKIWRKPERVKNQQHTKM